MPHDFVSYSKQTQDSMCCASSLGQVWLFATPWTAAHQAPLSMGILQARILEWVSMPSSGNLPNSGIKPRSPTLWADSLPSEPAGKAGERLLPANSDGVMNEKRPFPTLLIIHKVSQRQNHSWPQFCWFHLILWLLVWLKAYHNHSKFCLTLLH